VEGGGWRVEGGWVEGGTTADQWRQNGSHYGAARKDTSVT